MRELRLIVCKRNRNDRSQERGSNDDRIGRRFSLQLSWIHIRIIILESISFSPSRNHYSWSSYCKYIDKEKYSWGWIVCFLVFHVKVDINDGANWEEVEDGKRKGTEKYFSGFLISWPFRDGEDEMEMMMRSLVLEQKKMDVKRSNDFFEYQKRGGKQVFPVKRYLLIDILNCSVHLSFSLSFYCCCWRCNVQLFSSRQYNSTLSIPSLLHLRIF